MRNHPVKTGLGILAEDIDKILTEMEQGKRRRKSPQYEALLQKTVKALKSRPKVPPKSWAKRLGAELAKFTD